MNITMQNLERLSLAEMKEFVAGNRKVCLSTQARAETYGFIAGTLQRQQYRKLNKGQKGIERRFLVKVTGLSRAQMTRLVGRWMTHRCIVTKADSNGIDPPPAIGSIIVGRCPQSRSTAL